MQGLTQVPARQASANGQSWLIIHWGRQAGGAPNVPASHAQTARLPSVRHVECGPQGEGRHGSGCLLFFISAKTVNIYKH